MRFIDFKKIWATYPLDREARGTTLRAALETAVPESVVTGQPGGPDVYDSALIGYAYRTRDGKKIPVAVYSAVDAVAALVEIEEIDEEDAVDHFQFNTLGSLNPEHYPEYPIFLDSGICSECGNWTGEEKSESCDCTECLCATSAQEMLAKVEM